MRRLSLLKEMTLLTMTALALNGSAQAPAPEFSPEYLKDRAIVKVAGDDEYVPIELTNWNCKPDRQIIWGENESGDDPQTPSFESGRDYARVPGFAEDGVIELDVPGDIFLECLEDTLGVSRPWHADRLLTAAQESDSFWWHLINQHKVGEKLVVNIAKDVNRVVLHSRPFEENTHVYREHDNIAPDLSVVTWDADGYMRTTEVDTSKNGFVGCDAANAIRHLVTLEPMAPENPLAQPESVPHDYETETTSLDIETPWRYVDAARGIGGFVRARPDAQDATLIGLTCGPTFTIFDATDGLLDRIHWMAPINKFQGHNLVRLVGDNEIEEIK